MTVYAISVYDAFGVLLHSATWEIGPGTDTLQFLPMPLKLAELGEPGTGRFARVGAYAIIDRRE